MLLSLLILALFGIICSLGTKNLHRIILWFAPINSSWPNVAPNSSSRLLTYYAVIASVSICIALLVLTPNKQSATWVFTEVTDGSGWGSKGFSFLLGLVSALRYTALVD